MAADTYDPTFGLLEMGTGNDNNNWGTLYINSILLPTVRAIAGVNTITAVGGTVDLSTTVPPAGLRLDIDHIQLLTGALTSDLTVKVVNLSKKWRFENKTTGNFNVYVQVPGGVAGTVPGIGGLVQIPQGKSVDVTCDGAGNLYRGDRHEIGTFVHHGGAAAPAGALVAKGTSELRAEFPDLFSAIGTTWGSADGTHFTLPLLTDTNRYLRAADGTTITVGTYQANQNKSHTHTYSGTSSFESVAHTHAYSGTTSFMSANANHTHTVPVGGSAIQVNSQAGASVVVPGGGTSGSTNIDHTHTYSGSTGSESANHAHTYSGTTSGGSADGAEARPESAAVLICVWY